MRRVSYRQMSYYQEYFDSMVRRSEDFILTKTSYSRKIASEDSIVIFNDRGMDDNKTLHLINKVRSDGKKYKAEGGNIGTSHIDFFGLFGNPGNHDVMCKIDVNAAYWRYALASGVLNEETDQLYRKYFSGIEVKKAKQSRLKALGSLATQKQMIPYINGKPDYAGEIRHVEETKDVYMEVCRGVDELMKKTNRDIRGCTYYYWDCIFVTKKFKNDAVEFFQDQGYDVTVDETKIEVVNVNNNYYLLSKSDDKMYMTRKEDKHLLEEPF